MENKETLINLQDAWLKAKAEEERAKESRLLVESMILEEIGYDENDKSFTSWAGEKIKISTIRKEEYDNEELKKIINPEVLFNDPEFPFRVKIEPDARKMQIFKVKYEEFYNEKLFPIMKEKFSKPTFAKINKTGE